MNTLHIVIILVIVLAAVLFFLLRKKKPKGVPSEGTIEESASSEMPETEEKPEG